jgi:hypothetical protein
MAAAAPLPAEKHDLFLERVAGHLRLIGFMRVQDADVDRAVKRAIAGLLPPAPAAGGPWTRRA